MTRRPVFAALLALSVVTIIVPGPVVASPGGSGGTGPPLIPGARQVHIRNSSGGLGVYTSIPSGSI